MVFGLKKSYVLKIESTNIDIFTNTRQITLAKECLPIIDDNGNLNPEWKEYKYAGRWSKLLVQSNGDIDLVTDMSNDCFPIPNILLDMIKDGIVTK